MVKKTKAVLEVELKTSEKKTEELQEEIRQLDNTIQELQEQAERNKTRLNDRDEEIDDKDEEIGRNEEKIKELQDCLDDSLDKDTAVFFKEMISDVVEKIAKGMHPPKDS